MTTADDDELDARLGAECVAQLRARDVAPYDLELVWEDDRLVELGVLALDPIAIVLASPAAATVRRLVLGRELGEGYGVAPSGPTYPHLALGELLARVPAATAVCASAVGLELAGARHERLEVLSLEADAWPSGLARAELPALTHLEVVLGEPTAPVTIDDVGAALARLPSLRELRLAGRAFTRLGPQLGAIDYPARLALVLDVELAPDVAHALARDPGGLAELASLRIVDKPRASRSALFALERRDPAFEQRWSELVEACHATIDPELRVWDWGTREEGRASGWIVFLPHRPELPITPRERALLAACDDGVTGAALVYADWLEQQGALARAASVRGSPHLDADPRLAVRGARPYPAPRTLPEAALVMACAWKRVSTGGWIDPRRQPGSIQPLTPQDLEAYQELFAEHEHPLVPAPERTLAPEVFTERVRWLLDMMRAPPVARLTENEWTERPDAATFEPPLGATRAAFQLRDRWNDMMLAAETEHGYALLLWETGA